MNENLNVPECASQCDKIKAWLLEKRTITSWDAIRMFGCTRLAARVHDLRERGMDIKVRKRIAPSGVIVAEYYVE